MREISPETPEERRKHPEAHPHGRGLRGLIGPGSTPFEILRRVAVGVYNDGFIHAGNLAYLTLIAVFPFFIVIAAAATLIGGPEETVRAIHAIARALPPSVGGLIETTGTEVIGMRTGVLLWFGAAVGLWTVGSFIETVRDILRRAYGTPWSRPFWHYRLLGMAFIIGAVVLLLVAFSAQVLLTAAEEFIVRFLPQAGDVAETIADTRFIPAIATFLATYALFWALCPSRYRAWQYPKWPGALLSTAWWGLWLTLLTPMIELFGGYSLTYGGLAGVMVALLFFWLVGFGVVIGAHLNAALANPPPKPVKGEAASEAEAA